MNASNPWDIYGGKSPLDIPAYGIQETARYLHLPGATVYSWVMDPDSPLRIADRRQKRLSFANLVEVYVLSALRRQHKVKLSAVRKAADYLRRDMHKAHPLSDMSIATDDHNVFVEHLGRIVNATEQGQLEMKEVLGAYLKRIDRDRANAPIRLYPFTSRRTDISSKAVAIDPCVQFGRPCIVNTRIPTAVVAERFTAGDSILELAKDYSCGEGQIEHALRYESRPA